MAKSSLWAKYYGKKGVDNQGRKFVIKGSKGAKALLHFPDYNLDVTEDWDTVIIWLCPPKPSKAVVVTGVSDYECEVSRLVKDKGLQESEAVYQVENKYNLHGALWYKHYDVQRSTDRKQDWVKFLRTHKPVFFCPAEMMCGKWKFLLACHRAIYTNPFDTLEECLQSVIRRFAAKGDDYFDLEETREYLEYMARKRMELYGI